MEIVLIAVLLLLKLHRDYQTRLNEVVLAHNEKKIFKILKEKVNPSSGILYGLSDDRHIYRKVGKHWIKQS